MKRSKLRRHDYISLLVCLLYLLSSFLGRNIVKGGYQKQAFLIPIAFFGLLAVRIFFSVFTKDIAPVIVVLFDRLRKKIEKYGEKIRKKLGLTPRTKKKKNKKKDTYTFIRGERTRKRKTSAENFKRKKWKDLGSASDKVRYLYSHYVEWLAKRGVIFYRSHSPREILLEAQEKDMLPELISSYEDVRYSSSPEKEAEKVLDKRIEESKLYLGNKPVK